MQITKELIKEKVGTDLKWTERAVLAIYRRQTEYEKASLETRFRNSEGFNGVDARCGTIMARWILSGRHLSGEWEAKARKIMPKYAGQLLEITKLKK